MIIKTKIHFFVFIVLSFYITQSKLFAQSNSNEDMVTAPNSVYIELGGQGIFLSANYDRILIDTTPHSIALRAGLGVWANLSSSSNNESGVTIPINMSYLYGYNHKLELGVGYTIAPDISLKLEKGKITSPGTVTTIIGYRYQAIDGGFLFRVGVVFYLTSEEAIAGNGALSFGYAF